jgi:hypothetical protein
MLTRIEIDGFKSFRDFAMDIPPFLVIIGRNAAGKSNLFDAIQLLGRLAGEPVLEAAQPMRGDLADLFHRHTDGTTVDRMSFAVEVLLDRTVTDAFGDTAEVNHSRLRYELTIELRPADHTRTRRPYVVRERAHRIRRTDDTRIKRFDPAQRRRLAVYSGSGADLLETEQDEQGRPCFSIRQQGTQGRKRRLPAAAATATVLSSLTTATDFPLLYASSGSSSRGVCCTLIRARCVLRIPTTTRTRWRPTGRIWRTRCVGWPTIPAATTGPRGCSTTFPRIWPP